MAIIIADNLTPLMLITDDKLYDYLADINMKFNKK